MRVKNISTIDTRLRPVAFTVPVMLLIMLARSIVYFRERMLFIDAPHVFFKVVNDHTFMISDFRYGSFITQLVPLVGASLHVPLAPLLVMYSASFFIFYLAVALLLVRLFRNYSLAVVFGLYLTLMVSDTWYWPNNEVHQGIAWLMIAFALPVYLAEKQTRPWIVALVFIPPMFLALWTHPLVMFAAVYLWGFLLNSRRLPFSTWQKWAFSAVLLLLSFMKYYQGQHHGYDSTKIEVVSRFSSGLSSAINAPVIHYFLEGCLTNYWIFSALSVAGLAALLVKKKFILFLFTAAFALGFLLLLGITFYDLHEMRFYIESEYMVLTIICCTPFVYEVLPLLGPRAGWILLAVIFTIRLGYIVHSGHAFTNRIRLLEQIRTKMKEKNLDKVIIPTPVPDRVLIMHWGAPVESIILSQLDGDDPQRVFLFAAPSELSSFNTNATDTFYGCWDVRPLSRINDYYFHVDSSSAYKVIPYAELMK